MHPESTKLLVAHLAALAENGTTGSILFMTVAGTSDSLLAGVIEERLQLDYARNGILDFRRVALFQEYCAKLGHVVRREGWGNERVYRASVGRAPIEVADVIDRCFAAVYGHSGPYAVEFQPVGWQPSNRSFDTDAQGRPPDGSYSSGAGQLQR